MDSGEDVNNKVELQAMQGSEVDKALRLESRTAAAALDRAMHGDWRQVQEEGGRAMQITVKLRDLLIEQLRAGNADIDQAKVWQGKLIQLNAALSLIAGIIYPSSSIRREIIEQARDRLMEI